MVVPANLNVQMVSYGTYFLDYGSICQYQRSRREKNQNHHVPLRDGVVCFFGPASDVLNIMLNDDCPYSWSSLVSCGRAGARCEREEGCHIATNPE